MTVCFLFFRGPIGVDLDERQVDHESYRTFVGLYLLCLSTMYSYINRPRFSPNMHMNLPTSIVSNNRPSYIGNLLSTQAVP